MQTPKQFCHSIFAAVFFSLIYANAQDTSSPSSTIITTTTTMLPITTVDPLPPVGEWNVTDDYITCIQAELRISFEIPDKDGKRNFTLSPESSSAGSNCKASNITQLLVLEHDNYVLTFLFEKSLDYVFVKNITLDYSPEAGLVELFYHEGELFRVKSGHSYLCKTENNILLGNATMNIFDMHIYAFGTGNETYFPNSEQCFDDHAFGDMIPIVVACTLASCIIIVLVLYLLGRRRSRQQGYLSV